MLNEESGETKKALKLCEEILGLKHLDEYVNDTLEERLERIKAMKLRLSNSK